jgi:hypothetical protein
LRTTRSPYLKSWLNFVILGLSPGNNLKDGKTSRRPIL